MRALFRATIWHPDAIPKSEGDYAADLKRWVIPIIDVLLIIGSALAVSGGLPTFAIVYNESVSHIAAVAILVFSCTCLLGISFPKLWALELVSKCGLVFLLLTYSVLLMGLAVGEYPTRGFVAGVATALCVLLGARVVWLAREFRRRRATRAAEKALIAALRE